MTTIESVTEFVLDDHFSEEKPQVAVTADKPAEVIIEEGAVLTLPAALCDETLLKELSSIPDKMGFKIGEVAEMLAIKQYVLRYWESEFDVLKPKKASNNQRYYTKKDVENAFLIRKLLHRDRFSIEGARAALKDLKTFVKQEVKKEKDWTHFNSRIETIEDHVDDLLVEIQRFRRLLA